MIEPVDFIYEAGSLFVKTWNHFPDWSGVSGVRVNGTDVTMFSVIDGPSAQEIASAFETTADLKKVAFKVEFPDPSSSDSFRTVVLKGYINYVVKIPDTVVFTKVGICIECVSNPGSFLADAVCTRYDSAVRKGIITMSPTAIKAILQGSVSLE